MRRCLVHIDDAADDIGALAMKFCGLPQETANLGLQWHVIGMYGPSFFTGRLITLGAPWVVTSGLLLIAAAAGAGLATAGSVHDIQKAIRAALTAGGKGIIKISPEIGVGVGTVHRIAREVRAITI